MPDARTIDQFADDIRELHGAKLVRALSLSLKAIAFDSEGSAKDRYMNSGLKRPSSNLYNSIAGSVRTGTAASGGFADIVLSAGGRQPGGKSVRYARIQEEGGTIRPRGKYLAVPNKWDDAIASTLFQGSGQPRYASARDYPDPLSFFPNKGGGNATLRNKDGQVVYFLVRSVTLRGRHFLRDGRRDSSKRVPDLLKRAVRALVVEHG